LRLLQGVALDKLQAAAEALDAGDSFDARIVALESALGFHLPDGLTSAAIAEAFQVSEAAVRRSKWWRGRRFYGAERTQERADTLRQRRKSVPPEVPEQE